MSFLPGLFAAARPSLRPRLPLLVRTMADAAQFVAEAKKADPSLAGSDADAKAIEALASDAEKLASDIKALNDKLTPLTYLVGNAATTADVQLYCNLHPTMSEAPASQHPTHPAVLRYFLQIQSIDGVKAAQKALPNAFPPVDVDIDSLPAPPRAAPAPKVKKEKKDKAAGDVVDKSEKKDKKAAKAEKAAVEGDKAGKAEKSEKKEKSEKENKEAVAGDKPEGQKKEKKEKKDKPAKTPTPAATPSAPQPSMIDLRVGKVLDVKRHPDADSLYVETIDVGEPEPRTVCSGLVKYMTEAEIRDASVIVVCNLKPVSMRGVKSFAMLLCASEKGADGEKGGVEFVLPPAGAQAGDRVYFEGEKYENAQPEGMLNPKKKVFETIQPHFSTLETLEAVWTDPETGSVHKIRTKDGVCKAKSFKGASLS